MARPSRSDGPPKGVDACRCGLCEQKFGELPTVPLTPGSNAVTGTPAGAWAGGIQDYERELGARHRGPGEGHRGRRGGPGHGQDRTRGDRGWLPGDRTPVWGSGPERHVHSGRRRRGCGAGLVALVAAPRYSPWAREAPCRGRTARGRPWAATGAVRHAPGPSAAARRARETEGGLAPGRHDSTRRLSPRRLLRSAPHSHGRLLAREAELPRTQQGKGSYDCLQGDCCGRGPAILQPVLPWAVTAAGSEAGGGHGARASVQ